MIAERLAGYVSAVVLLHASCSLAAPVPAGHVGVELISEQNALVPGARAWLGLHLVHEPHWHTYWINPGDSGLATKLQWSTPREIRAGDIAWPTPQRFDVGGLFNFGYAGDVVLPVPVEVMADARPGTTVRLAARAKWLVCREECVPGQADLEITLPVAARAAADTRRRALFAQARTAGPLAGAWQGSATDTGDRIEVTLHGRDLPQVADAFVVQRQVVGYAPPRITPRGDALVLAFDRSEYFTTAPAFLDVVFVTGAAPRAQAWSVRVPFAKID